MTNSALVTRLLDHAQLRVPNIPQWLRDDLALAAETIIELRRELADRHENKFHTKWEET